MLVRQKRQTSVDYPKVDSLDLLLKSNKLFVDLFNQAAWNNMSLPVSVVLLYIVMPNDKKTSILEVVFRKTKS